MDAKENPVMAVTLRSGSSNSEPKTPRDRLESGNIRRRTTHSGCFVARRESDS
jgi:hypothetical protein